MVIQPEPELERLLSEQAKREGVAPEELVLNALRERFVATCVRIQPQDEWERQLLDVATDCGVSLTHESLSSDELYE